MVHLAVASIELSGIGPNFPASPCDCYRSAAAGPPTVGARQRTAVLLEGYGCLIFFKLNMEFSWIHILSTKVMHFGNYHFWPPRIVFYGVFRACFLYHVGPFACQKWSSVIFTVAQVLQSSTTMIYHILHPVSVRLLLFSRMLPNFTYDAFMCLFEQNVSRI